MFRVQPRRSVFWHLKAGIAFSPLMAHRCHVFCRARLFVSVSAAALWYKTGGAQASERKSGQKFESLRFTEIMNPRTQLKHGGPPNNTDVMHNI